MSHNPDLTESFFAEADPARRAWVSRKWASLWDTLITKSLPRRIDEARGPTSWWLLGGGALLCGFVCKSISRFITEQPRAPQSRRQPPHAIYDEYEALRKPVANLSRHYSGLHRGALLFMAVAGVLAVACALLIPVVGGQEAAPADHGMADLEANESLIADEAESSHLGLSAAQQWLVSLEALLILAMLAVYASHRSCFWQERYVDYRLIAERLRHVSALSLLGRSPTPFTGLPQWGSNDPRRSWAEIYAKSVIRSIGLAPLGHKLLDTRYLEECRDFLVERWLGEQIEYHETNSARMTALHMMLDTVAVGAVFLTFLACVAHFWGGLPQWCHESLHVPAGVLPAIAAACHSISARIEAEKSASRSEAMAERLQPLQAQMSKLCFSSAEPATSADLGEIVQEAANIMYAEAGEWRVLFQTPVPPPH